ncbi:hypothetical protein [Wenxinia saemankumensis]|uniref:Lipoprotein n=1 Tax=Wenxinia saemankumensis TaxID=1447782 RepID=A0A1M6E8U4_9RHOB|nr:hypothetical protein [Wenxinia saemankumensis]SHI81861.1 hypothetical protein SAMN05444417_1873 [Wenxinia saemankumensis]
MTHLTRRAALLGGLSALAACATAPETWAPDSALRGAAYTDPGGPLLTLYTMKSTSSGAGNHTGLMISASQRVIFDPAGTFGHPSIPERNELHYGITPRIAAFYESYHARATYYVLRQDIPVSAEVAERAFVLAQSAGPVSQARCTTAVSRILRDAGVPRIRSTFFPGSLSDQVARLPGVRETEIREDDDPDKAVALETFDQEIRG